MALKQDDRFNDKTELELQKKIDDFLKELKKQSEAE